ncbi:unnamed protein product [Victoria cruziana]
MPHRKIEEWSSKAWQFSHGLIYEDMNVPCDTAKSKRRCTTRLAFDATKRLGFLHIPPGDFPSSLTKLVDPDNIVISRLISLLRQSS